MPAVRFGEVSVSFAQSLTSSMPFEENHIPFLNCSCYSVTLGVQFLLWVVGQT